VANNPYEDIYEASKKFLEGVNESSTRKKLIIPDILKLPPAKRKLVVGIIKTKTNTEVSSADDYSRNFVRIKEFGEIIKEIPEQAKKIKWLFK
jgi:hypothetical protein